jgi:hypothetical protein
MNEPQQPSRSINEILADLNKPVDVDLEPMVREMVDEVAKRLRRSGALDELEAKVAKALPQAEELLRSREDFHRNLDAKLRYASGDHSALIKPTEPTEPAEPTEPTEKHDA